MKVTITKQPVFSEMSDSQIANYIKTVVSSDKNYAWDKYIIFLGLQPRINAKEFYQIFDSVLGDWKPKTEIVDVEPNYKHTTTGLLCHINQKPDGVTEFYFENGYHGSFPPSMSIFDSFSLESL